MYLKSICIDPQITFDSTEHYLFQPQLVPNLSIAWVVHNASNLSFYTDTLTHFFSLNCANVQIVKIIVFAKLRI